MTVEMRFEVEDGLTAWDIWEIARTMLRATYNNRGKEAYGPPELTVIDPDGRRRAVTDAGIAE